MKARTPTSEPPISPALWQRLRRFEPHCDLKIERAGGRGHRQWKVEIKQVGRCCAAHGGLAEALERAASEAESWGWHLRARQG